jgi:hypothetical protein
VCGLARSGTTIVTHVLNAHRDTGSFLYRDLPFIEVPYFWSFINGMYYGSQKPALREHGDELMISPDSPDAFEELLWKNGIEDYETGGFCRVLDEHYENEDLEKTLPASINKVLHVRGKKSRYLAKGNYNLLRLKYILKLFPDARIILCVREPLSHAHSLARVHAAFSDASSKDPYFAQRLDILGHYEFGPLRRAIKLDGGHYDQTTEHWSKGEDYLGYLLQWNDVYDFARAAYAGNPNVLWLDSATVLTEKERAVDAILRHCNLPAEGIDLPTVLDYIKGTTKYSAQQSPYDAQVQSTYAALKALCV